MHVDIARKLMTYRGHNLAASEPLLLLLKLADKGLVTNGIPPERAKLKRILADHGYRVSDDDPVFLCLDLMNMALLEKGEQVKKVLLEDPSLRGGKTDVKLAAAAFAMVGVIGMLLGLWLTSSDAPRYTAVAAATMVLIGAGAAVAFFVTRKGSFDGAR
jgi:hypothetical protein